MVVELIFSIILVISLVGMGVILFKRMPDVAKLPEPAGDLQQAAVLKIRQEIKRLPVVRSFSYEMYLQKMLSRIRILTLKTDSKTSGWLERLRQRQNKNNHSSNNDKYWEELKKAKDGK